MGFHQAFLFNLEKIVGYIVRIAQHIVVIMQYYQDKSNNK